MTKRQMVWTASCLTLCWCLSSTVNADELLNHRARRVPTRAAFVPADQTPQGGAPRGPGILATDFEPGEGFVLGPAGGQNGWLTNLAVTVPNTFTISNVLPQSGTQHVRTIDETGTNGDLHLLFSPDLGPLATGPNVTTVHVRASNTGGANYTIVGQSPSEGFLTWRVEVDFGGDIVILDDIGAGLTFIDTGFAWPVNQYFELRVEQLPGTGQIAYFVNGANIYNQAGGNIGGTRVEQVIVGHDAFQLAGETADFDNITVANLVVGAGACCDTNTGMCTDVADANECSGAGVIFTNGQTCAQVTCEIANGACCTSPGRVCNDGVDIDACVAMGGTFGGDGSTCATFGCPLECPPGHSGQITDGQANNTALIIASLSDTNPIIGAEVRVADNFVPTVSGSITSVRWWGEYLELVAGLPDCDPIDGDSADNFQITYYLSETDGTVEFPGQVLAGPFSVTPSKISTGLNDVNGTEFFEFDATHPAVAVDASFCYWIEILNNTTGSCGWYWMTGDGNSGDEEAVQNGGLPYTATDLDGNDQDQAWCLNVQVNNDGCVSAVAPPGACCDPGTGVCNPNSDSDACAASGGTFLGAFSTCVANACSGACCDGQSCSFVTEASCGILGGLFFGVDTDCADNNPCSGACCDANGFCSSPVDINFCETINGPGNTGGSFHPNLTCLDLACPSPFPFDAVLAEHRIPCGGSDTSDNSGLLDPTDTGFIGASQPDFSCLFGGPGDGAGSYWKSFIATDVSALITTRNSAVADTIIAVYDDPTPGDPNNGDIPGEADEIACSEDIDGAGGNLLSEVCVATVPGQRYYLQIASFDEASQGEITVEVLCPCPVDCTTCPGDLNGDTILSGLDVQGFTDCVTGGGGDCLCADMDDDGDADIDDVGPFVTALLAGGFCPGFPIQECPAGSDGQLPDLENALASNADETVAAQFADNFDTTGGTVTSITWWGEYLPGDTCPDSADSFDVAIFADDNNGAPGTPILQLTGQTPTRVATGRNLLGLADEFRYTLSGLNTNLAAGCYWLAIGNEDSAGGCVWFWSTSNDGDAINAANTGGGFVRNEGTDPVGDDIDTSWCLTLTLGDNSTCLIPQGACCVGGFCSQTTNQDFCENVLIGDWFEGEDCGEGFTCPAFCDVSGNCQFGNFAFAPFSDLDDGFQTFDDFLPTTSNAITGICVDSAYILGGTCTGAPFPENFRVAYYPSIPSVSQPGGNTADLNNPIAEFDTNGLGGGLNVISVDDQGINLFAPGVASNVQRITFDHAPVPATAGVCMWVEVTGLADGCSWTWLGIDDAANGAFGQVMVGGAEPTLFLGDMNFCVSQPIDTVSAVVCN